MSKYSKNPFIIQEQSTDMRDSSLPDYSYNNKLGSFFINDQPSTMWLGRVVNLFKFNFALIIVAVVFIILFTRLSYLQLVKGQEYRQLAEGNRIHSEYILPNRGIIFDHWHQPLVENVSAFSLYFVPKNISESSEETEKTKQILNTLVLDGEKLATSSINQLTGKYANQLPILLKENVDYNEALHLMVDLENYPELKIIADPKRNYLSANNSLAHLLGYTSRITEANKAEYLKKGYLLIERIGNTGIEGFYQDDLRGLPGAKKIEVDSLGKEKKVVAEEKSEPGKNLVLGIDRDLQEVIAASFKKYLGNLAAAAVAIDPRNGKVRAMVSWPSFDNNIFSQSLSADDYNKIVTNPLKPLINRTISAEYPSGSIIKMVVGSAGLQENLITESTQVLSTGGVWYDKWFFPDWKAGGHGLTNIIKALAESVNTFFYYLALEDFDGHHGLGIDKLTKYFRDFGLGKITGIDLKSEKPGFVPSPSWKLKAKNEAWYPGDTMHLAIGQGDLLVTPLQMANITAVVANGGTLYQPQILESVEDSVNNQQQIFPSKILNQNMVSQSNLKIIAKGMRECVVSGSGRGVANPKIEIAGKTGTAQAGEDKLPHAWFTSYAPYDQPELALTIIVEHGGEGSSVAVPIARDVWQWYADNRLKK
jgi:penicillin-binding protein 2